MSVTLRNISKSFGRLEVIRDVSLEIGEGEFAVFVGPSGCGKSTLLRMIAGLESITSGQLFIGGEDVSQKPSSQRGIAMVFQSYALYPHLSVFENMAFGLRIANMPKAEIKRRVTDTARTLQLEEYLHRLPRALSGGQRQRVAIGRAIVREPRVFLFDEPLSNLDAALRSDMRVELTDLHSALKTTMIYVTHDQVEAMTLADRIVVLNAGNIEQVGSPLDLYERPETEFVARFIGSPKMNLLAGEMAAAMGAERFGVRPEHIRFADGGGRMSGVLRHLEHLGADTLCYIDADGYGPVLVRRDGIVRLERGDTVFLDFDDADIHRFSDGKRLP